MMMKLVITMFLAAAVTALPHSLYNIDRDETEAYLDEYYPLLQQLAEEEYTNYEDTGAEEWYDDPVNTEGVHLSDAVVEYLLEKMFAEDEQQDDSLVEQIDNLKRTSLLAKSRTSSTVPTTAATTTTTTTTTAPPTTTPTSALSPEQRGQKEQARLRPAGHRRPVIVADTPEADTEDDNVIDTIRHLLNLQQSNHGTVVSYENEMKTKRFVSPMEDLTRQLNALNKARV